MFDICQGRDTQLWHDEGTYCLDCVYLTLQSQWCLRLTFNLEHREIVCDPSLSNTLARLSASSLCPPLRAIALADLRLLTTAFHSSFSGFLTPNRKILNQPYSQERPNLPVSMISAGSAACHVFLSGVPVWPKMRFGDNPLAMALRAMTIVSRDTPIPTNAMTLKTP
jgi:hypothetical protein